jgi:putative peptidoglycan lipid II flippase
MIRVGLTTVLGYFSAIPLPHLIGINPKWGVAGLTASAGVSGWIEFLLLRRALANRIGRDSTGAIYLMRLWGVAIAGAVIACAIKLEIGPRHHPIVIAIATLIPFGVAYFALADPAQNRERLSSIIGRKR